MGCWSSSKAEKSKRWAAGVPARAKNQKDGRREIPQAQIKLKWAVGKFRKAKKSKRWASENSASPNRVKMARRKIPQAQIKLKRGVGKFRKAKSS